LKRSAGISKSRSSSKGTISVWVNMATAYKTLRGVHFFAPKTGGRPERSTSMQVSRKALSCLRQAGHKVEPASDFSVAGAMAGMLLFWIKALRAARSLL
jgi:hypothetical protein